jgi:hypothetical protein
MTLKHRQEQIILYLYHFRFLNRSHIQQLLGHKHFNRIIIWLNQLTTEGYIRRYHNPKTVIVAAQYSLGSKSRKYLLQKSEEKKVDKENIVIQPKLLNRIWREQTLSEQFHTHCLFIADIYLSLLALVKKTRATLYFFTKTDLCGHDYILTPLPDAYIAIKEQNGKMKRYFLDIFDPLPPRMILRRRIKQYVDYYDENTWQETTKHPFPQILLISPDERSKRYLHRYIQKTLEYSDVEFFLATWEQVKTKGLSREILENVKGAE